MSVAGVRQLRHLFIRYSQYDGSSRGVREFIEHQLPTFQAENPTLRVHLRVKNRGHPILLGKYRNQHYREKQICVKNLGAGEVLSRAIELRNQTGGPAKSWSKKQWSQYPSVQGIWTPLFTPPRVSFVELPPNPDTPLIERPSLLPS